MNAGRYVALIVAEILATGAAASLAPAYAVLLWSFLAARLLIVAVGLTVQRELRIRRRLAAIGPSRAASTPDRVRTPR